jgi:outer membrane lipoprotein SlyB
MVRQTERDFGKVKFEKPKEEVGAIDPDFPTLPPSVTANLPPEITGVPPQEDLTIPPPEQTGTEILTDDEGNVIGTKTPEGDIFFGVTEQDIAKGAAPGSRGELLSTADVLAVAEKFNASQKALNIFQRLRGGQPIPPDIIAQLSPSDINFLQATGVGVAGASAGVVGGAVVGGVAGGGVGAIPGAVIGGIGAGIAGFRSDLASQQAGNLEAKNVDIERIRTEMQANVNNINSGGSAVQNTETFFDSVAIMQRSYAQLKLDTGSGITTFTGKDGAPQLRRYKLFFEVTLPRLELELSQSIINPDPTRVRLSAEELE